MSYERLYVDNVGLIESVVLQVCRRHLATDDDIEEFRSIAHIKLIDDEYRVLRDFEGRSSLRGFLLVVLEREFLDYRNAKWGKWRPSQEAVRMGERGILLERLVCRDRYSFDEAVEIIGTNHRISASRDVLWDMLVKLPARRDRRPESDEKLASVPDPRLRPDEAMHASEKADEQRRAYAALATAVSRLEPEDRLIMKLQYFEGLKQVEIAAALRIEPKRLYRRCKRILAQLRVALEAEGVDPRVLDLS